jgi:hypothetical protein
MASTTSGFRWNYDAIRPSLKSAAQKGQAYMSRTTTYHALRAEAYARVEAAWRDRTGNARQGLKATAQNGGSSRWHYEIWVSHSVNYGIWLEVRFGGRYAIIAPTIRREAPEYFETARQVLDKMFGQAGA